VTWSAFFAGESQGAAGDRRGVGVAHRHRRDAVQQHQDVVREEIVQARDRGTTGGGETIVNAAQRYVF